MAKQRNILLVVEGKRAEGALIEKALECYGVDGGFEFFSYEANVEMIYGDICDEFGAIPDDLDTMLFLRERERKLHPDFDSDPDHVLLQTYTDVIFILDYDPHQAEEVAGHALVMAGHFRDSADCGKLFVNYPMLESYRHLSSLPDPAYLHRTESRQNCCKYKQRVGQEALPRLTQLSRYDRAIFDQVISHNYFKATRMLDVGELDLASCQEAIMEAQSSLLGSHGVIRVLHTCLFFILDYWPTRVTLEDPYAASGFSQLGRESTTF